MKTYALVNGKHVRYAELRETPKFLISVSDSSDKFKKTDKSEYIASSLKFSDFRSRGYRVYEVDHPHVLKLISDEKKSNFVFKVEKEIEKIRRERITYERAAELNKILGLGLQDVE